MLSSQIEGTQSSLSDLWFAKTGSPRRLAVSNAAGAGETRSSALAIAFLIGVPVSWDAPRYYLILARDFDYGDVSDLRTVLVEVSKLLEAYSQAILNSDS